jgi:hypothetical protein
MNVKDILGVALIGVGGYVLYEMFFATPAPAVATATTTAGSPAVAATTANTNLTVADAAVLPYNSAITSAQMQAINAGIDAAIQSGSVPQIAGNSVLAFMLGWGGLPAQTSRTTSGQTYIFDGTNWNLQAAGTAGLTGYYGMGQHRIMTGARRINYVRRMA